MKAFDAARIFHDWATNEGLMTEGPMKPVSSKPAELLLIDPASVTTKQILRRRGVQGVIYDDTNAKIVVLLKKAAPTKKELAALPEKIDNVSVSYHQGAPAAIGGEPAKAQGNPPFIVRHLANSEHYACGSSISQGNCRDAGTLGSLVRDAQGIVYGLSNNHVTGGCSHANKGLPILAPGVLDVMPLSHDPFTIGYHERALDMMIGTPDNTNPSNNLDAAMFKIADESRVTSYQGAAYDTPSTIMTIEPGLSVEKVGRTTGHTHGSVIGQYYGGLSIFYDMDIHGFKGRVFFDPIYAVIGMGGAAFSDHGDSGSLVTALDNAKQRHAVGIVVGGMADRKAPGGVLTFILPIDSILNKFGVSLVSGHNV